MPGVVEYLEGEDLLRATWDAAGGASVQLTQEGIREVEAALDAPNSGTEFFPPAAQVVVIGGDNYGPVQQAGRDATQHATVTVQQQQAISQFLDMLSAELPNATIGATERAQAEADIATVRDQLNAPRPRRAVLKPTLDFLRDVAANIVASGGAAAVLTAADAIQF